MGYYTGVGNRPGSGSWAEHPKFSHAEDARKEYARILRWAQSLAPTLTAADFKERALASMKRHWPYANPEKSGPEGFDHNNWLYGARMVEFTCAGCGNRIGYTPSLHRCRGRGGTNRYGGR